MIDSVNIQKISEILGHNFHRDDLIQKAFTHRSCSKNKKSSYERLEFIGDRVLGLVIADMLLSQYPLEEEGELARRLTELVRAETLAEVAEELNLGKYIIFGEKNDKMRSSVNILSDVVEASIGAMFRDGGLEGVRPFMEKNFRHRLEMEVEPPKDGKTIVQEWAQKKGYGLPKYELLEKKGTDHDPTFTMAVVIDKYEPIKGLGKNKQEASQNSASNFIMKYGIK